MEPRSGEIRERPSRISLLLHAGYAFLSRSAKKWADGLNLIISLRGR
jgi:hypothetical protein